jgi:hypothetical protein
LEPNIAQDQLVARLSDVVRGIPGVGSIKLARLTRAPRLQSRGTTAAEADDLMHRAKGWYDAEGIPFWDALFILGERDSDGVPASIIESALFHQPLSDAEMVEIPVDDNLDAAISNVLSREKTAIVAIVSEVRMIDGSTRHIPMLDFTTKSHKPGAFRTVTRVSEELGLPGLLVSSGRSFHFYGQRALTQSELTRFLASALLFTPIVDSRWIAHQLLAGVCALRLSTGDKGFSPEVVARIEGKDVSYE